MKIIFLKRLIVGILLVTLFSSCATKDKNQYNKPAIYWYQNIFLEIKNGNLEAADGYYSSLQSEHINSPLLPTAIMALYASHMHKEEYILSEFYIDEYLKRYATNLNSSYLSYLKIKSRYLAFRNNAKDQEFMLNTIVVINNFLRDFKDSMYIYNVEYILAKFELGLNELNTKIYKLYDVEGRRYQEGAKLYKNKIDEQLQLDLNPIPSHTPWWIKIFNW